MQSVGFRASMSRKADCCYDNTPMESFFHTPKPSLFITVSMQHGSKPHAISLPTFGGFYNRTRRHSAICYFSPIEMELKAT
jgi:putative transposase